MAYIKDLFSKKFNFLQAILLIGFIPLIIAVLILTSYSGYQMEKELEDNVYLRLKACATSVEQYFSWDIAEGILTKDETSYEFIDSLMSDDIVLTFFEGDTRFITSVKDDSGNRVEGTKADETIWNLVKTGQDYKADMVKIAGHDYYVYYTPVYDANGDIYGMAFAGEREEIVNSAKTVLLRNLYIISGVLICLFGVVLVFVAKAIRRPIVETVEIMEEIADGKLNNDSENTAILEEMKSLIHASKVIRTELGRVVGNVNENALSVKYASEKLGNLTSSSNSAAEQISVAMDELASTAMVLAENVQDVNAKVIEMGNDISDINEDLGRLDKSSFEMKDANNKATESMGTIMKSSSQSAKAVGDISKQIEETNNAISQIDSAVSLIMDITSQTKLLSLNASIEAARAGEHGKGFAVVASEIQKLSEQSANGATAIKTIADNMLQMSQNSVSLTEEIIETIKQEQKDIELAQKNFELLSTKIEENTEISADIQKKTQMLDNVKQAIISNVNELSAISEENAASNQEVTANISNISNSIKNIDVETNEMKEMSEALIELIKYFKLN